MAILSKAECIGIRGNIYGQGPTRVVEMLDTIDELRQLVADMHEDNQFETLIEKRIQQALQ